MSEATVFRYFPDKNALMAATRDAILALDTLLPQLAAAALPTLIQRLAAAGHALAPRIERMALLLQNPEVKKSANQQTVVGLVDVLAPLFNDGRRDLTAEQLAGIFLGTMMTKHRHRRQSRPGARSRRPAHRRRPPRNRQRRSLTTSDQDPPRRGHRRCRPLADLAGDRADTASYGHSMTRSHDDNPLGPAENRGPDPANRTASPPSPTTQKNPCSAGVSFARKPGSLPDLYPCARN